MAKEYCCCERVVTKGGITATALEEVTLRICVLTPLMVIVALLLKPLPVRGKKPPL